MLIIHYLHNISLNYIFIVKILYKAKGSIVAYVLKVLWFPDLFNIVSLFQTGFSLTGITLSWAYMIDEEDYTVKENTTLFFDFSCALKL